MQHSNDENPNVRLLVEDGMAIMVKLEIADAHMSGVSARVGEFRQRLERLMKLQNIAFGAGKAPLRYRIPSDALDVGIRSFG